MGSKFVTDIKDEVEEWEISLGYIGFLIDEWIGFQRQWMYLENIFNAADI
jgi:dynein heavy chain